VITTVYDLPDGSTNDRCFIRFSHGGFTRPARSR
jgi:hypothetical protein